MSRQVTLKRLTLVNFKGLRNVAVEFGDGVTTISGRNGTGKTTIADSFAWLLWGKDSEGNSDSKCTAVRNSVLTNIGLLMYFCV